jgi:peptide/nickel transport system substrate-binding protein
VSLSRSLRGARAASLTRRRRRRRATLVVDRSFEIKTPDPQRAFEPTASIVDRGDLRHAVHVQGRDLAHPDPAARLVEVELGREATLQPSSADVHFADGTR